MAAPPFRPRFQSDEGSYNSAQKLPSEGVNSQLEYYPTGDYNGKINSAQKNSKQPFYLPSGMNKTDSQRERGVKKATILPQKLQFKKDWALNDPQYPSMQYQSFPTKKKCNYKEGWDFVGSEQYVKI